MLGAPQALVEWLAVMGWERQHDVQGELHLECEVEKLGGVHQLFGPHRHEDGGGDDADDVLDAAEIRE